MFSLYRSSRLGVAAAVAAAVSATALTVPSATAAPAVDTCKNPGYEVESGTVDWGIKESFRGYIHSPIAQGKWELEGKVTEDEGKDPGAKDFQFHFEVDPQNSKVTADKDGNITAATINTKDSRIVFSGHHGILYTNMSKPYFEVSGQSGKAGVEYLGYYVPGKTMTEYKVEDRVEANKKTGKDTFTEGMAEWSREGNKATLSVTKQMYVPKPGTHYDRATKKQYAEGVDVLFLGMYHKDYKPEIDDAKVSLNLKPVCLDGSAMPEPAPSPDPAPSVTPDPKPSTPAPAPKPAEQQGSSEGNAMTWAIPLVALVVALLGGGAWFVQNQGIPGLPGK